MSIPISAIDATTSGIQGAGFDPTALRLETIAAEHVQKRFRDLAARAVMNADEKDSGLRHGKYGLGRHRKRIDRQKAKFDRYSLRRAGT